MKTIGTLLFTLILSSFAAPRCGATVYQSNGSLANVQALHDAAHDGDTITLPAGIFSWRARLNISKGITIQGATVISGPASNPTINDGTIIKDDTPRTGSTGILTVRITHTQSFRLTGITFAPGSSTTYASGNGAFRFASTDWFPAMWVRVDHCHFASLYQGKIIGVSGWLYGVADHNVLDCRKNTQSFFFNQTSYGGPSQINGNGSWADYPWYGTNKFFFAEDNRINGDGTSVLSGNSDTTNGARYVFRHNYWKNAQPNSHGTEGGLARGGRAYEVYDNTFEWTILTPGAGQRSGTSLWHDNRFIGVKPSKLCSLPNFRQTPARPQPVWGIADGTSVWDANDTEGNGTFVEGHPPFVFASGSVTGASVINSGQGTFTDSSKNWTPNQWVGYSIKNLNLSSAYGSYIISNTANTITYSYYGASDAATHLIFNVGDTYQIHRVLNMMDQNGSGKGDQITGLSQPINTRTGTASYNHQAVEPCYSWNNMHTDGTALGYDNNDAQPTTKEGRDYFNLGGRFPANTTPAAVYLKYTAALNGVNYVGTFVYPHPLVTTQPLIAAQPTSTQCSLLQRRLDRLERRQQRLERRHRSNPRLGKRIRRLKLRLQRQHCP
jgi:hypothetical protein